MQGAALLILSVLATSALARHHFASLKDATGKIKINYLVDQQLKYFVDVYINSTFTLPDFSGPDASGTGVSISGVNTMKRTADNYVTLDAAANSMTTEGAFGLGTLTLNVQSFTRGSNSGDIAITITDSSFGFKITATIGDDTCSATVEVKVLELSGSSTVSSNANLNGLNLDDELKNRVIPYMNQAAQSPDIQKQIHDLFDPCMDSRL